VGSRSIFERGLPKFGIILYGLSLTGCGNLHYLLQAGGGQFALFNRARPISEVLKDEKTPPRIRGLLTEITAIKKFGEANGLKPTQNYTDYVKLDRNAAVYVVSACESLKFKSKEWNFPFVGSFPYLGWFDRDNAKEYATELEKEGWDVDLRGARAYSTLGWFRDAVLSPMIPDGPEALGDLVNVVIHESVHATLYINGQAYFNESIASFVADHLTLVYLDRIRGVRSPEKLAYVEGEQQGREIEKNLHVAYQALADLYVSPKSDAEKLEAKLKILTDLKEKTHFRRPINNATLIQFKTYRTGREDFEELFQMCGSSWPKLLATLKTLRPESFVQPQLDEFKSVLDPLVKQGCPQGIPAA
jgi:predicted aminopeptidase